jgi:hypothetical protein
MNYQKLAFRRKVIYLSLMVALLFPLSWLGLPSVSESDRDRRASDEGVGELIQRPRVLASLQHQHGLAEANLGKIDPTSATLKLATFGLRGVAANLLWNKADEYKKTENWSKLESVLDQISHLQPNFVSVWRFQGWNLAYNVSAEWDDYRGRYYWVLKGTKYVHDGQAYNQRDARLVWDEGWFTGHKLGRADEFLQFRRLFRDQVALGKTPDVAEGGESEFPPIAPARRVDVPPDNWMYAWAIFLDAVDLVRNKGARRYGAGGSDTVFYSEPAKCRMRYVSAKVEEGEFSREIAVGSWQKARQEWEEFGNQGMAAFEGTEQRMVVRLSELQEVQAQLDETIKKLEELSGTTRAALVEERMALLAPEERQLLDAMKPPQSQDEVTRVQTVQRKTTVTNRDLAAEATQENRDAALSLAKDAENLEGRLQLIRNRQGVVNYEYWLTRCIVEGGGNLEDIERLKAAFPNPADPPQTPALAIYQDPDDPSKPLPPLNPAYEARKIMYQAHQEYDKDPFSARESYEKAFEVWKALLHDYPILEGDGEISDDLMAEIRRYERVLDHHGERITEDFVLKSMLILRPPYPPIGPFGRQSAAASGTLMPMPPVPPTGGTP